MHISSQGNPGGVSHGTKMALLKFEVHTYTYTYTYKLNGLTWKSCGRTEVPGAKTCLNCVPVDYAVVALQTKCLFCLCFFGISDTGSRYISTNQQSREEWHASNALHSIEFIFEGRKFKIYRSSTNLPFVPCL